MKPDICSINISAIFSKRPPTRAFRLSATTPGIFRLRSSANFANISKSSGKNIPKSHWFWKSRNCALL